MTTPFVRLVAADADGAAAAASRLPAFVRGPSDPAAVLGATAVMVVGNGAVGAGATLALARAGIGALYLVDDGRLKPESLLTHPLDGGIGTAKVAAVGGAAVRIRPAATVYAFAGRVEDLPAHVWPGDVVVLATDNLAAEVAVAERCLRFGRPLLQASVHGASLVAQVRSRGHADEQAPCLVCAYDRRELRELAARTQFSCDGQPAPRAPATRSPAALCGLAADLAVLRLLRWRLGLGRGWTDEVLEFAGYGEATVHSAARRNPGCPLDHRRWHRRQVAVPLGTLPVGALRDLAAAGAATVEVVGHRFVDVAWCSCGTAVPVRAFVAAPAPSRRCPRCGESVAAAGIASDDVAPFAVLPGDARLADLGAAGAAAVVVRAGDGAATLITGAAPITGEAGR